MKAPNKQKSLNISIRVDDVLHEKISEIAGQLGLDFSETARKCLKLGIGRLEGLQKPKTVDEQIEQMIAAKESAESSQQQHHQSKHKRARRSA